jgi:hypothetical protein
VVGVRERVRHRQLRPVRDPVEGDLVEGERLAHGVEVLGVLRGAVELAIRADRGGARRGSGALLVGRDRGLDGGTVDQPRSPVPRSSYATSV